MLKKSTLREIKHSLGRYLAILAIVALGVGFFSGLKVSKTAMVTTGDQYLKEANFFDYRLLCSLGFTEEDVEAISADGSVVTAEGAKWADAPVTQKDGTDIALRIHSITDDINALTLTEGRMPEKSNECAADSRYYTREDIGSTLVLSEENSEDSTGHFTEKSFTIVGLVQSPYYMNYERGTTSIGNGTLGGFLYVPESAFSDEYYSEIFVTLGLPGKIYSQTYTDALDAAKDRVTALCEERGQARYQDILAEAEGKIADARQELSQARAEYADEKAKAEAELADAAQKLAEAQAEIDKSRKELDTTESRLQSGQQQWESGQKELTKAASSLEEHRAAAVALLDQKEKELQSSGSAMTPEALKQALEALSAERAEAQKQYEAGKLEIQQKQAELDASQEELARGYSQLEQGRRQLDAAQEELDGKKAEYESSKKEAEEKFAQAEKKIKDAEAELALAEEDVSAIEEPTCYTLSRNTNVGYACFENDSNIVEGIANVFPVFFFLVAALVCMTTMNRMIDEQRTQIGVLKALGYSKAAIMSKYIFYSGSAALIGCITGFLAGSYLFPQVIWKAYGIMYGFAPLKFVFDVPLALISLAVSLVCSAGVTWLSCSRELSEAPAQLIRPKSPKAGKRILLERIPWIWKHLKFLQKVSIRNMFRYKKRLFMMILGIGGCTALLLTGFGIRDSIQDIAALQYTEIQHYDYEVTLKEPLTEESLRDFQEECSTSIDSLLPVSQQKVDLQWDNTAKSVTMMIPEDTGDFTDFVSLHRGKKTIPYPGPGEAVINKGLAEEFDIETGDTLTFTDSDMHTFTLRVTGIFDNYVYNYVYISADTYQAQTGTLPEYKYAFVKAPSGADVHQGSALLMSSEQVRNVTVSQDIMDRIGNMMSSLDYIVVFITLSAAALAFIVLYNLTNINITERTREIATVKVLGFNGKETASYVFRENVLLTLMGSVAGLGLGIWLHAFVISQIKIDLVTFSIRILPMSYVLAVALTLAFAGLVNFLMYFKTERINMAEALKSIE